MSGRDGFFKSLQDEAWMVFQSLGGTGTVADVRAHMKVLLSDEACERVLDKGLDQVIATALRRVGVTGLPMAPSIDDAGTHMQLELLSPSEFKYVIRSCLVGKRRYHRRAEQYAHRCAQQHGVIYDLAEIEQEISEEGLTA